MDPAALCPGPALAAILAQPCLLFFGLFFVFSQPGTPSPRQER